MFGSQEWPVFKNWDMRGSSNTEHGFTWVITSNINYPGTSKI